MSLFCIYNKPRFEFVNDYIYINNLNLTGNFNYLEYLEKLNYNHGPIKKII